MSCKDCIFFSNGYCESKKARINLSQSEMVKQYNICGHSVGAKPLSRYEKYLIWRKKQAALIAGIMAEATASC